MSSWKKKNANFIWHAFDGKNANFIWHAFDGLNESVNAFVANLLQHRLNSGILCEQWKPLTFSLHQERAREPGGIWTPAAQVLQRGLGGRVSVQPGGPESQPRLQGTGFVCGERGEESVTAFLSSISTDVLWCSYIMRGGRRESWHSLPPQGMKICFMDACK